MGEPQPRGEASEDGGCAERSEAGSRSREARRTETGMGERERVRGLPCRY